MKRLLILFVFAASTLAQSANVIQLEPADSARAQKAWDALQKAQAEWDAVKNGVSDKYVTGQKIPPHNYGIPGWENGIEFAKDFKAIVPKAAMTSGVITLNGCSFPGCTGTSCFTAAPAVTLESITPDRGLRFQ